MTIQFSCGHCGTVLKTTDDKAGKQAKCPGCSEVIDIPAAGTSSAGGGIGTRKRKSSRRDDWDDDDYRDDDYDDDYGSDYDNDYDDRPRRRSGGGSSASCPMCGERVSASASRCKYCGEDLDERGRGSRTGRGSSGGFEAGESISTAWAIFQTEWGICLGALLLPFVIQIAINFLSQIGIALLAGVMADAMGDAGLYVFIVIMVVWVLALVLFGLFIQCGQAIVMVNVVRNRSNGIADLFGGGPYIMTLLLNVLVVGLACVPIMLLIGGLGAIAPALSVVGVLLFYVCVLCIGVMIWPMTYALVDQNLKGLEPLKTAFSLTEGYRLTSVLMFLLLGLINLGGALLCGVGLLITVPLSMLSLAVAYCRLARRKVHV